MNMEKSLQSKKNNWKRIEWILENFEQLNSNELVKLNNFMFRNNQISVNSMVQILTPGRGFVQISKVRHGSNITRTWKYEGIPIEISYQTEKAWKKRLAENNFIIL